VSESNRNPTVEYFHVFAHEYWHYWHNVSTIGGLKQFYVTQHLLAEFSGTLESGDGTSMGSAVLGTEQNVSELLHIQDNVEGEVSPELAWRFDLSLTFVVTDARIVHDSISLKGTAAPVDRAELMLQVQLADGSERSAQMLLGAAAIEESVAFLVEEHFRTRTVGAVAFASPQLPYLVLERTLEHIVGRPLACFTTISLGTLALLMTHPGPALVTMARDLRTLLETNEEATAMAMLIKATRDTRNAALGSFLTSIREIGEMHKDRAMIEGAYQYLLSQFELAVTLRLEDPVFDLRLVLDEKRPMSALIEFMKSFPPCDVLQERVGNVDDLQRDDLVRMSEDREDQFGFTSSIYTRVFQAQQTYLYAHVDKESGEFLESKFAKLTRCPEYTSCALPLRQQSSSPCSTAPWRSYRREHPSLCRYGVAVSASVGTVQVRPRPIG